MKAKLSAFILRMFKWESTEFPDVGNCVVAVAPHTSMWDFIWGKLYIVSQGRTAITLIKKEMFRFPFGIMLRMMGAVPVDRTSPQGLARQLPELFACNSKILIAITPEGTRKKVPNWKKGFIHIAKAANVPIVVGFIDYRTKKLGVLGVIESSGDTDEIMQQFKKKFIGITAKHPERFTTGYEE